jgi:hypothetical protein
MLAGLREDDKEAPEADFDEITPALRLLRVRYDDKICRKGFKALPRPDSTKHRVMHNYYQLAGALVLVIIDRRKNQV